MGRRSGAFDVEFRVKHMVIQTVRGRFRDIAGAIVAGEEPSVSGAIKVASLETLHEERDEHLRSPDFFDVERHPEIVFHAGAMEFNRDVRRFALAGELTINGVTRPIRLDGEPGGSVDADGREPAARSASFPPSPRASVAPATAASSTPKGNRTAGPAPRALDRYEFSIRNGRLTLGRLYSVSHVDSTGAQARIHSFPLTGDGEPVTGVESWLYPMTPPS